MTTQPGPTQPVTWLESRPPERIVGDGVVLQRAHAVHVDGLVEAVRESLPELQRWMPWAIDDYGPAEAREWQQGCDDQWPAGGGFAYVILEDDRIVGTVGLINRLEPGWLEIGYWVRTLATGKRLARRATAALIQATRTHLLEVEGVAIHHAVGNDASRSVPIGLDFVYVGESEPTPDRPFQQVTEAVWRLPLL